MTERIETALERIADALEILAGNPTPSPGTDVTPAMTETQVMQARAEYHRDNAAELFGDKLELVHDSETSAHWVERATGKPVVFTPHGWLLTEDVKDKLP